MKGKLGDHGCDSVDGSVPGNGGQLVRLRHRVRTMNGHSTIGLSSADIRILPEY